jgi:hypothetical protein
MNLFRLKTKEVRLPEGYAILRNLYPADIDNLKKIFANESAEFIDEAIVASSIVEIIYPDYNKYPNESDYMIQDPEKPFNLIPDPMVKYNYITDPNDGLRVIIDPNDPIKYVKDSEFPENKILDKSKSLSKKYTKMITKKEEVFEFLALPLDAWKVIAYNVALMSQPNPSLLGELRLT